MATSLTLNSSASPAPGASEPGHLAAIPKTARRLLRVPLTAKLLGANLLVVALALAVAVRLDSIGALPGEIGLSLGAVLLVGTGVNIVLTWIALRPIRDIEATIWRMWHGDAAARVAPSVVADTELNDIAFTLNSLLDHLERDRRQMRELAAEVIRAGDVERDRVGQELRESIAQSAAAVTLQISAMINESRDPAYAARLGELRVLAGQVLDQLDVLSHSIHPRVLNDLGLVAGLRRLARDVASGRVGVDVRMTAGTEEDLRGLGLETASALYRVALEAVQNAIRHARANRIKLEVGALHGGVALSIIDDGRGFDVPAAEQRRPGMGLFTMRQRVALIGGAISITSRPGAGTEVCVTLPGGATSFTRL